jgi:hypothetical protein
MAFDFAVGEIGGSLFEFSPHSVPRQFVAWLDSWHGYIAPSSFWTGQEPAERAPSSRRSGSRSRGRRHALSLQEVVSSWTRSGRPASERGKGKINLSPRSRTKVPASLLNSYVGPFEIQHSSWPIDHNRTIQRTHPLEVGNVEGQFKNEYRKAPFATATDS